MPVRRFVETQPFRQTRLLILLAIPPVAMSLLCVWQAGLGHPWGKQPLSNTGVIGWTIFLWLIYLRLITIRLVTEVRTDEIRVGMRGLWRARRIPLQDVQSAAVAAFDPVRDYGGYGVRSTNRGVAYLAGGNRGVRLELANGSRVTIGSRRPEELAQAIGRRAP
jgi:hypothetical protein